MSDQNHRQSILPDDENEEPPKRLVSAPTLYCLFAFGIVVILVGTFVSAHAYLAHQHDHDDDYDSDDDSHDDHEQIDEILRILGPILIGVGVLILLGMSFVCIFVYKRNQKVCNADQLNELFSVGESTFYDNQAAFNADRGLNNQSFEKTRNIGLEEEDPMVFLANAVMQERRRKLSRHLQPNAQETSAVDIPSSGSGNATSFQLSGESNKGFLAQEAFSEGSQCAYHRSIDDNGSQTAAIEGWPNEQERQLSGKELQCQDCVIEESLKPMARNRFQSMTLHRPPRETVSSGSLRRIATVTPMARDDHRQELRRRAALAAAKGHPWLPPELATEAEKKKKRKIKEDRNIHPKVHQLDSYSPEVIGSLIEMTDKQLDQKSVTFDTRSPMQTLTRPNVTHTSANKTFPSFSNQMIPTERFSRSESNSSIEKWNDNSPAYSSTSSNNTDNQRYLKAQKSKYKIKKRSSNTSSRKRSATKRFASRHSNGSDEKESGGAKESSFGVSTLTRHFESASNDDALSTDRGQATGTRNDNHQKRKKSNRKQPRLYIPQHSSPPSDIRDPEANISSPASPSETMPHEDVLEYASPHCPPTPSDATLAAVSIMRHLCDGTHKERRAKALSVISSHDERCDSCDVTPRHSGDTYGTDPTSSEPFGQATKSN